MIWFVNNSLGVNGDGRLSAPFNSLPNFVSGAADDPGDNIFIFTGGANYAGPITLLNNQKLIGQGATASLSSITGITPPAGSLSLPATGGARPVVAHSANNLTLGSGNTLRGFNLSNTNIKNVLSDCVLGRAEDSGTLNLTVTGGSLLDSDQAFDLAVSQNGDMTYDINGVTMTGHTQNTVQVIISEVSSPSNVTGTIRNNTIGSAAIVDSGSELGFGINMDLRGNGTSNQTIHEVNLSRRDDERPAAPDGERRSGRAQYYFSRSQRVPFRVLLFDELDDCGIRETT